MYVTFSGTPPPDSYLLTRIPVETVAFALSVLVVTYTVQDGKSNYLEGAMVCLSRPSPKEQQLTTPQLFGLYLIIALAFWASPTDALGKALALLPGH